MVGRVATPVLLMLLGCPRPADSTATAPDETRSRSSFSGARAFATLQAWMTRPRTLGNPERARSITALAHALETRGAEHVERIAHAAADPGGTGDYALVEIIGHFREDAEHRFILATHFDTRPWADEEADPALHDRAVPGANDGTSGLAVVLELIEPLLARLPADVGFSVVLFDGEELGRPTLGGYCMGSRHLGEQISGGRHPLLATAEFGIVLDMVGDIDLRLLVESNSLAAHPALVEHVWGTAQALGVDAFDPTTRPVGIIDDHKFLTSAGIPSILLIDREYAAWHRVADTIERIDPGSLARVGMVVLESVVRWYER